MLLCLVIVVVDGARGEQDGGRTSGVGLGVGLWPTPSRYDNCPPAAKAIPSLLMGRVFGVGLGGGRRPPPSRYDANLPHAHEIVQRKVGEEDLLAIAAMYVFDVRDRIFADSEHWTEASHRADSAALYFTRPATIVTCLPVGLNNRFFQSTRGNDPKHFGLFTCLPYGLHNRSLCF